MYAEVPDLDSDLFQAVWDAAGDIMALTDPEGIVLSVNQAYLNFYGVTREEVIGRDFTVVFADDFIEEARARYKTLFAAKEDVPPVVEVVIRRKDGTEWHIESRLSYLTEHGRRKAMLSIARDISDRKAAQNASAHLAAIVESSEDAILSKTL